MQNEIINLAQVIPAGCLAGTLCLFFFYGLKNKLIALT